MQPPAMRALSKMYSIFLPTWRTPLTLSYLLPNRIVDPPTIIQKSLHLRLPPQRKHLRWCLVTMRSSWRLRPPRLSTNMPSLCPSTRPVQGNQMSFPQSTLLGPWTSTTTTCLHPSQRLTSISNQQHLSHPRSGLLGPWTSRTTSCLNPRPRLTSTSKLPILRSPFLSGTQTETLWWRLPPFLHHLLLPGPGLSSSKDLSCLQGSQAPNQNFPG